MNEFDDFYQDGDAGQGTPIEGTQDVQDTQDMQNMSYDAVDGSYEEPIAMEDGNEDSQPIDNDNDMKRYQYWQSKYNRLENEFNQLKSRLEQNQTAQDPLMDILSRNPELLREVLKEDVGSNQGLQMPQPPEKPADYNEIEAYSDPNSESYKYRIAQERYRQELLDYKIKELDQKEQTFQQTLEEQKRMAQQQQQVAMLRQQLAYEYGFNKDQIMQFERVMSDPNTLSLPNLVKFFNVISRENNQVQGTNPEELRKKAEQIKNQTNKNLFAPNINGSGGVPQQTNIQEEFMNDIARQGRSLFDVM